MVETEVHVLFECEGPPLSELRNQFYVALFAHNVAWRRVREVCGHWEFMWHLLRADERGTAILAEWVRRTFVACEETPVLQIQSEEDLEQLQDM